MIDQYGGPFETGHIAANKVQYFLGVKFPKIANFDCRASVFHYIFKNSLGPYEGILRNKFKLIIIFSFSNNQRNPLGAGLEHG